MIMTSDCSIFSMNPMEESSIRVSNMGNNNNHGYCKGKNFNWDFEPCYDDTGFDSLSNDILRVLPVDPFGMGVSTFTTITGWVESNTWWNKTEDLKDFWNTALKKSSDGFDCGCVLIGNSKEFCGLISQTSKECVKGSGSCSSGECVKGNGRCSSSGDGGGGAPHDAMFFALRYLGVKDLLSVERVCKSLRSAVRDDVLLWRDVEIGYSLSMRISDEALLRLTNRAQGNLLSLSLVECLLITDNGLKGVLQSNRKLTKLNVTGCSKLSVDGIVNNLKAFNSSGASGIKHLRIGVRYGLTQEQFDQLKSLVNVDKCVQPKPFKPHYYHYGHLSLSCDDDRDIDIEKCPRCNNLTVIYDCPSESCKKSTQLCRACIICIQRCVKCGRCVSDSEFVETFCLDYLCLDCWCQEGRDEKGTHSKHVIFQHETTYCVHICG